MWTNFGGDKGMQLLFYYGIHHAALHGQEKPMQDFQPFLIGIICICVHWEEYTRKASDVFNWSRRHGPHHWRKILKSVERECVHTIHCSKTVVAISTNEDWIIEPRLQVWRQSFMKYPFECRVQGSRSRDDRLKSREWPINPEGSTHRFIWWWSVVPDIQIPLSHQVTSKPPSPLRIPSRWVPPLLDLDGQS